MSDRRIPSSELAAMTGITYRRLDYWSRLGLVECVNPGAGHGTPRTHPETEVRVVALVRRLTDAGLEVRAAFLAARQMTDGQAAVLAGEFGLFDLREEAR